MPLAELEQEDWAAGMFRGFARHLIPANGFYDGVEFLLDDDGQPRERGGVADLTTSNFSGNRLTFLWVGHLTPGERIVLADSANFAVVNGAGTGYVTLGGGGLTEPKRAVEVGGILYIGGGKIYGGSRLAADYSTGTVTTTNGSKTVTGSGTSWTANVDVGMLFKVGSERYYVVASVDSNTQITLRDNYQGTTAGGKSYACTRLGTASIVSDFYAASADRLLAANGARINFSDVTVLDPAVATSGQGGQIFGAADYHEAPEGATALGAWDVGTSPLFFTSKGIFAIRNLSADLVDAVGNPQQRIDHLYPQVVLWGNAGIASEETSLVVPALDGAYLIDGISAPLSITASIPDLWRTYVEAGHRPGLAIVYRSHYFLPILSSAGLPIDCLVCRLDRPVRIRGVTIFPWTRLGGYGSQLAALARRVSTPIPSPQLLGASNTTRSRILNCTGIFTPAAAIKNDADGTTPIPSLVTRDYTLGEVPVQLKRVRAEYELDDAGTDDPLLSLAFNTGDPVPIAGAAQWGISAWGNASWTDAMGGDFLPVSGSAPEDPEGDTPYEWPASAGFNVRTRRIRFKLFSAYPNKTLRIRALRLFIRPNRKT